LEAAERARDVEGERAPVVLTVAGRQYDAFQVATDCVAAWEHYLENRGLRFGKSESSG